MKRIHRLLLSALSGVLLSLPWLGLPGWTLFFAFIPLLVLDEFFTQYKAGFPEVSYWGHAFLAAFIWNIAASWWMAQVTITGVASAMLLNSFLISLVLWLAHLFRRKFSSQLGYIALVVFWISLEYLQFNWDMEWPCLQLGSVLASNVSIIQWYEYTGAVGGTLWVLVLNILLFRLAVYMREKAPIKQSISTLTAFVTLVIMPLSISWPMYFSYEEEINPLHISIVQPNVDPYQERFDLDSEKEKLNNVLELSQEVANDKTDIILAPESVFENLSGWNEDSLSENKFVVQMADFIRAFVQAEFVFGASTYKVYPNKESATITAKTREGKVFDIFNTAILLNREGETQSYHKSKLVMGVEKTPLLRYFPFLKSTSIKLDGIFETLGQDSEATNLVSKNGTCIAPVICFESVFGEYVADFVKNGAEVIFVLTNDGWWKNSRGYKQHLLFSQLRAIETRRSIARAANTGTSCFINQRGDVIQPTAWWQTAAINGTINTNKTLTFYVKHDDFIARGAVFASILLVMLLLVKRFR